MKIDKDKLEKIVQLYFNNYSAKEAIDIVNKNIKLEDVKESRGWQYQQLKMQ